MYKYKIFGGAAASRKCASKHIDNWTRETLFLFCLVRECGCEFGWMHLTLINIFWFFHFLFFFLRIFNTFASTFHMKCQKKSKQYQRQLCTFTLIGNTCWTSQAFECVRIGINDAVHAAAATAIKSVHFRLF